MTEEEYCVLVLSYVLPLVVILKTENAIMSIEFHLFVVSERFVVVDDRFFFFAIVENDVH